MTCYHPLTAFVSLNHKTDNGKKLITFSTPEGLGQYEEIRLPCGKCIGCRLERSRQWAIRSVHEALLHEENCFITLTYSDEFLHPSGSLKFHKKDFVDFMKRLRKKFGPGIRFLHCGEYGELWQRPHHHAIIFGLDFHDKVFKGRNHSGNFLYTSPTLERLWPFGIVRVGACSFESVAYVARYVTKKITGDEAYAHYYGRDPEYITMSRRPGIGHDWLLKNPEIYNYDEVVIRNGIHCKPPAYYDRIFDDIAPEFMEDIKEKRKVKVKLKGVDSIERLSVKEEYKLLAAKKLIRNLEKEL